MGRSGRVGRTTGVGRPLGGETFHTDGRLQGPGDEDDSDEQVTQEQEPQFQQHQYHSEIHQILVTKSLLLRLLFPDLWLHPGLDLQLEPHVEVQQHESHRDEERQRAPGLVGDTEERQQCHSH